MRRTDFALLRHEQIAREVSNPGFEAHDYALFVLFFVTVFIVGVTA